MKKSTIALMAIALLGVCSAPAFASEAQAPTLVAYQYRAADDPSADHTGMIHVHGYTTKKGHVVHDYWRHKATHHANPNPPAPQPDPNPAPPQPDPNPAPPAPASGTAG